MLNIAVLLCLILTGCQADTHRNSRACFAPAVAATPSPIEASLQETKPAGSIRVISAYNAVPEQTDSTPCIGATGIDLCARHAKGEKLCATRAFPIGTRLSIDSWGTCTVTDRTNSRYRERIDLFFGHDVVAAKKFGKRKLRVTPQ